MVDRDLGTPDHFDPCDWCEALKVLQLAKYSDPDQAVWDCERCDLTLCHEHFILHEGCN